MMDRRWLLIEIMPCARAVVVSGAGTEAVNGTYCPDGLENGLQVWTKIGGTRLEDSIYTPTDGVDPLPYYVVTSGGTYEDDPNNALYNTYDVPASSSAVWSIHDAFGGGGAEPSPTSRYYADREPVIRDFGCLQPARFSEEEDLSVGCIGKRRKLNSDIVFSGADFDYFRSIERDATRRCEELTIRRQWRCNGVWKTIWTGTFSTGSGEWDFDKCEFTVRPDVLDEYTCIMRAMNKKVNVMQVAPVDAEAVIIPSLEFGICIPGLPNECPDILDTDGVTPINEYQTANCQIVTSACPTGYTLCIYWRERQRTFCVAGVAVSPIGAGWTILEDNCAVDGTAVYVRNSTIPWTFGDATIVENASPNPTPPNDSCAWVYLGTVDIEVEVDPFCPGIFQHFYICLTSGAAIEYTRARPLQEIADYFLDIAGCTPTEMVSDFLEWNPPGDAPGYAVGINYVTGGANQHNAIVVLQNSDALDPAATNPATLGEMTLKEFFALLTTSMRLFWKIDALGRLRVEHWSFWTTPVGLSVATYATDDKSEPLSYAHLKSDIPRYERPKWAHAQGSDFVGADIEYSGPCVSTEGDNDVREYNAGQFTTDLAYIDSDPDAIGKQGFTLLATTFDGLVYNTILDHGALSGNFLTNAPMSWANLERDFWQHDRFLPTGTMNREATEFLGFVPNIEQRNVFLKFCCDYVDFDSSERVQTRLGIKLGNINAFVRRAEFDEATDGLTLTLRYAY